MMHQSDSTAQKKADVTINNATVSSIEESGMKKGKSDYWKQRKLKIKQRKKEEAIARNASKVVSNPESSNDITLKRDEGIECEVCCSVDVEGANITMCHKGHVFCKDCARRMAEIQLGARKCHLPCMTAEICDASFDEEEVRGFLNDTNYHLWERLKAEESIKTAGLANLEQCPFCDFACVIESPRERLFTCMNAKCKVVSCRSCHRENHLPMSCSDLERQIREKDIHKAEELLSIVIMRKCPQKGCNTPIIKDETVKGCNRVTCAVCSKDMCYCCRKDVSVEGYRHFDMESKGGDQKGKCPLWEDTIERHKIDIEKARERLGRIAPKQTSAERSDEVKRRKQRERAVVDAEVLFDELGAIGLGLADIDHTLRIPDKEQEEWQAHQTLLRRRELQTRQKQKEELVVKLDLSLDRNHLERQHQVRMQILGIGAIIPEHCKSHPRSMGPAIHFNFDHISNVSTECPSSPKEAEEVQRDAEKTNHSDTTRPSISKTASRPTKMGPLARVTAVGVL